jgi:hypothetical protein
VRVELAVKECRARLAADEEPSFRALGRRYGIDWSRIRDRINRGQGTRASIRGAVQATWEVGSFCKGLSVTEDGRGVACYKRRYKAIKKELGKVVFE